jgi:PAS domain S-box-containing protein
MEGKPHREETFRLIVEAAPNAIVVIDERGEIVIVNSQTEKFFGYARDELVGRPVALLVPARFRNSHPDLRVGFFVDARAADGRRSGSVWALRKDRSEFPVEIGLNPLRTEGGCSS